MQYLNSKVQHKTKQFKRYESLKHFTNIFQADQQVDLGEFSAGCLCSNLAILVAKPGFKKVIQNALNKIGSGVHKKIRKFINQFIKTLFFQILNKTFKLSSAKILKTC